MLRQGTVKKLDDGRYELTARGRTQAEHTFGPRHAGPKSAGDVVDQMDSFVSYMEDAKSSQSVEFADNFGKLKDLAKRLNKVVGYDESGDD